jgi:hypothetical protein
MKKFLDVFMKDIISEEFTAKECLVFGVVVPVVLVLIMGFAGWMDTLV